MSVMIPKMISTPTTPTVKPVSPLPVRTVPGSYGIPMLGALRDRLDYFWFQGPEKFYKSRMEKHNSTVLRTNVPPSFPLFTGVNPNVIALLDCKSYSYLFETDLVDKAESLLGEYRPNVNFAGGVRVCPYLDTSEPQHAKVKSFILDILKQGSANWSQSLTSKLDTMWDTLESEVSTSGSAQYRVPLQEFVFSFLVRCFIGVDPTPEIAKSGPSTLTIWLALQVLPTIYIGILQPLEEIFLHSFAYPFAFISRGYNKLVQFIETTGKEAVDRGVTEFKLTKKDALHNLLFVMGFNAFGGLSLLFLALLGRLGSDTTGLQPRLRAEAREKGGANLSFDSVKEMELIHGFVYESLRFQPTVPSQYGRAKKDFLLSSHDAVYEIKKGELLVGFLPVVMRDPKVYDDPDTFKCERFINEKGKDLLNYLYWSNGPQTGEPTASNKMCAAKDMVIFMACFLLAHMLRRYDSITLDSSSITSVEKAVVV
ncbi:hypothetical protein LguiB_029831 [Lonicera macranthoides]